VEMRVTCSEKDSVSQDHKYKLALFTFQLRSFSCFAKSIVRDANLINELMSCLVFTYPEIDSRFSAKGSPSCC
jgi:hypothetical protein